LDAVPVLGRLERSDGFNFARVDANMATSNDVAYVLYLLLYKLTLAELDI